jgi:uncharacterized protein
MSSVLSRSSNSNGDKAYSFTDALSFAVMERLGISIAFALDQHFDQFGRQMIQLDNDV